MKKKSPKIWRYILLLFIVMVVVYFSLTWDIKTADSIYVKKWDTIQAFMEPLSSMDRIRLKLYLKTNSVNTQKIQTWTYVFSWSYSPAKYIEHIMKWPEQDYIRYTMLEGWSIYDVDADMSQKWLIQPWALLQRANDEWVIAQLSEVFPFLKQSTPITTLEGFLYPDTYFLSTNSDIVTQFFQASLKRFDEKIIPLREKNKSQFTNRVKESGISLSFYGALTLSSVIEKEERASSAKPTIAGIFINRLWGDIQLWADITLCYGLKEPYESCTPSVINRWIYDKGNIYNTRIQKWLPPTPISSVTDITFDALMNFSRTKYLFYLHDNSGKIYYAETNAEHEENKRNYLR